MPYKTQWKWKLTLKIFFPAKSLINSLNSILVICSSEFEDGKGLKLEKNCPTFSSWDPIFFKNPRHLNVFYLAKFIWCSLLVYKECCCF